MLRPRRALPTAAHANTGGTPAPAPRRARRAGWPGASPCAWPQASPASAGTGALPRARLQAPEKGTRSLLWASESLPESASSEAPAAHAPAGGNGMPSARRRASSWPHCRQTLFQALSQVHRDFWVMLGCQKCLPGTQAPCNSGDRHNKYHQVLTNGAGSSTPRAPAHEAPRLRRQTSGWQTWTGSAHGGAGAGPVTPRRCCYRRSSMQGCCWRCRAACARHASGAALLVVWRSFNALSSCPGQHDKKALALSACTGERRLLSYTC